MKNKCDLCNNYESIDEYLKDGENMSEEERELKKRIHESVILQYNTDPEFRKRFRQEALWDSIRLGLTLAIIGTSIGIAIGYALNYYVYGTL